MPIDPQAFGQRLQGLLKERGQDIKSFQEALVERTGKARGTSYGSVWSYVNGHAPRQPRREVVEAMAELLEVNVRWLLGEGGPRSPTHAAVELAATRAVERQRPDLLPEAEEGFKEGLGWSPEELGGLGEVWLWKLFAGLRHSMVDRAPTHKESAQIDRELARRIGTAVMDAVRPFDVKRVPKGRLFVGGAPVEDRRGGKWLVVAGCRFSQARWSHYVAQVCEALYTLLAAPRGPADDEFLPIPWEDFISEKEGSNGEA